MFRKILIAVAALAAVGAAAIAFTATPAAAYDGWRHHRNHNQWRPAVRFHNSHYGYRNCYVQRVIYTQFGPRLQTVNICY